MRLRRCGLCLLSTFAGLLLAAGLFSLATVASAAPADALATARNYPGGAPCNTTLQACINGSNGGDVINILAGVFTESFTLSKAVSLVGAGVNLTWLRAQPNDRVITITSGIAASILISGVTIAGGNVRAENGLNAAGGGLLSQSPVTIVNSLFLSNTALVGGGLMVYGTAAIQGVVFQSNEARDLGGGAYIGQGAVFTGVTVVDNRAGDGGGLFFSNASRQAVITGSIFSGNVATTTAGTGGVVFGYVRAATQTLDSLVNTTMTGPGTPASRAVQAGLGPGLGLTGTTITSHTAGVVALGALAPISTSLIVESWPADCPVVMTYTRPITIWYGSTYADGVPVLEMASATQLINRGSWAFIQATGRPELVLRGLYSWIHPGRSNIELVVDSLPTFDAEAHLRTALAAAWRPAPYTGVRFDPPIARGTDDYLLQSFVTTSACDDGPVYTTNVFQARVTYVELNAIAVELRQLYLPLLRR